MPTVVLKHKFMVLMKMAILLNLPVQKQQLYHLIPNMKMTQLYLKEPNRSNRQVLMVLKLYPIVKSMIEMAN